MENKKIPLWKKLIISSELEFSKEEKNKIINQIINSDYSEREKKEFEKSISLNKKIKPEKAFENANNKIRLKRAKKILFKETKKSERIKKINQEKIIKQKEKLKKTATGSAIGVAAGAATSFIAGAAAAPFIAAGAIIGGLFGFFNDDDD